MKKLMLFTLATLLAAGQAQAVTCDVANGQAATFVLGQNNLTSAVVNPGGASASTIRTSRRVFSDGTRFYVADTDNHRVLIYNSLPTTTFQAADLVLGQADFTSVAANRGAAVGANTMAMPAGVFSDGTRLFVADYSNNRVLIWNSFPTVNGQAADLVLGQAAFTANAVNRTGVVQSNTMYQPASVAYRGGKLFVGDTFNHRVLIWNSLPTANGQAADLVVGQPSFTINTAGCSAAKMHYPHHVDVHASKMIVADTNNNRYLIFNSVPTVSGTSANNAIGQSGLNACIDNAGGITASSISWAVGFTMDDAGDLWVSDYGNSRVLRYAGIPTTFAPAANRVLGQANFTSGAINRTGSTSNVQANTMYWPYGVVVTGGKLYVTDQGNTRVLGFGCPVLTATPTSTVTPTATPTPTSGVCPVGASVVGPWTGIGTPGDLLVSAEFSNRVFGFDPNTETWYLHSSYSGAISGAVDVDPSDPSELRVAIGNTIYRTNASGTVLGVWGTSTATGLELGAFSPLDGSYWVADQPGNRIFRFPAGGGAATGKYFSTGVNAPGGCGFDDAGNLFVSDAINARILKVAPAAQSAVTMTATVHATGTGNGGSLVFDGNRTMYFTSGGIGTTRVMKIDTQVTGAVLLTTTFSPLTVNGGGTLYQSHGVALDLAGNLWIVQNTNPTGTHGLLKLSPAGVPLKFYPYPATIGGVSTTGLWADDVAVLGLRLPRNCTPATPTFTPTATSAPFPCPLVNGQSAVLALGQPDLTSNTLNNGGVSASSMNWPYRLASDGTRLIVPDAANHRVLIWNTLPTSSGQPADVVLGQANFTSNLANRGGSPAANTLNYPSAARVEGGKLVVADYSNHRVLIWNSIPTVNGQAADVVVGQADFTSGGINRGAGISAPQANSLYQASSARIIGGKLFILDAYNHRVLIYNSVPTSNGASADLVLGQALFTTNSSGLSASKMLFPNDVESDGTRLWVVDANQNRVLGWSSFPTVNGQAANFALGQSSLTSATQGSGTTGLYAMNTLMLHNGDLYVSDYGNNRVLRYSPAPSSFAPAASLVLGQADFSGVSPNRGGSPAANTLSWPYGLAMAGGALWVTDMNNHRVLKYGCSALATATPTATMTPTPAATCADCSEFQGGYFSNGLGAEFGVAMGAANWSGNSGAAPVYIEVVGGMVLSGFVPRGPRGEGVYNIADPARLPSTQGFMNLHFNVDSGAAAVPMTLMDYEHGGRKVKLEAFGPGHANAGYLRITYSTATGTATALVPYAYAGNALNDLDAPGGPAIPFNPSKLGLQFSACGLRLLTGNNADPGTAGGVTFSDYAASPSVTGSHLSYGNNAALGAPIDGWFDDIRVWTCAAGSPTRTPTASATPGASHTTSPTRTPTVTPSATATITPTSGVPVASHTPSPSMTRTATPSPTSSRTSTRTATPYSTLTATPTRTVTGGLTPFVPSATATQTPNGPVPTATATPRKKEKDEKRVDCHPNYVRGHGEKVRVTVRSYSGGECKIKVNRANGRECKALWKGNLQVQEERHENWDTRDEEGEHLASGVYYVVFTDGDGTRQTQKVLIVR